MQLTPRMSVALSGHELLYWEKVAVSSGMSLQDLVLTSLRFWAGANWSNDRQLWLTLDAGARPEACRPIYDRSAGAPDDNYTNFLKTIIPTKSPEHQISQYIPGDICTSKKQLTDKEALKSLDLPRRALKIH